MIFVGAFVVAYILSNYVIVNAKVPSGSMISTINIDDKVIGFRLSYLFSDPERGDIVMFNAPDKENTIYIKRIIGVPGDTITISDNQLYINGELQEESYVKNGWTRSEGTTEYVVPEGEYFMMGDNRDNSSDSRVWGTVKKDDIIAKAIFRYYPSVKSLLK
jgi:signal peptidase I